MFLVYHAAHRSDKGRLFAGGGVLTVSAVAAVLAAASLIGCRGIFNGGSFGLSVVCSHYTNYDSGNAKQRNDNGVDALLRLGVVGEFEFLFHFFILSYLPQLLAAFSISYFFYGLPFYSQTAKNAKFYLF